MASYPTPSYRSQFGDTTLTKVFVGGLEWETPTVEMHRYFEQFGDILETVIITDRATGKSRGYGFVGFRRLSSLYNFLSSPVLSLSLGLLNLCPKGDFPRPRVR